MHKQPDFAKDTCWFRFLLLLGLSLSLSLFFKSILEGKRQQILVEGLFTTMAMKHVDKVKGQLGPCSER